MPCLDGCVCTVLPPLYCRGHAHSLRSDHKDLWVVFFPRCTAGPKLVGSCRIRLHTTANMHATTSNIVGTTMLGVLAPVCTQRYGASKQATNFFVRSLNLSAVPKKSTPSGKSPTFDIFKNATKVEKTRIHFKK